jgi:hypothetical protein
LQVSSGDKALIDDSLKIVDVAKQRNVSLRLLGALAISLHSSEFGSLYQSLKRLGDSERAFTDIDLIGYSKERVKVREVLEDELGYVVDQNVLLFRGKERLLYHHPEGKYYMDIFFDRLNFSHDINMGSDPKKGRLQLDYPTITATDLLLEKLQIHEISQKDLKDVIVLLRAHDLGIQDNAQMINSKHFAMVLADDWGFWKDATANLHDVLSYAEKYRCEGMLPDPDFADISGKVAKILKTVENEPKSQKWDLRSRTGESKQWWKSVEDVSR